MIIDFEKKYGCCQKLQKKGADFFAFRRVNHLIFLLKYAMILNIKTRR